MLFLPYIDVHVYRTVGVFITRVHDLLCSSENPTAMKHLIHKRTPHIYTRTHRSCFSLTVLGQKLDGCFPRDFLIYVPPLGVGLGMCNMRKTRNTAQH